MKWATFALATAGAALAVYTAATARTEPPRAPLAAEPSINPFSAGIAATGVVEAATRNIPVGVPEPGLAISVPAEVGQTVAAGQPLLVLDTRALHAERLAASAAVDAARARLERIAAQPRTETLPPLQAAVDAAAAELADALDGQRRLVEAGPVVMPERDLARAASAVDAARARLAQAQANLALARAGAWDPDLAVARAELDEARARVEAIDLQIARKTVAAPVAGTVLKRNVEPGQFVAADPRQPAIVLGDLSTLHVRARVDEEDIPMLQPGASAIARVRGRAEISIPLTMIRIEPLVEPKTQLTGSTTERVDTRVIDVLFRVNTPADGRTAPMFPGQNVDVFIDGAGAGR